MELRDIQLHIIDENGAGEESAAAPGEAAPGTKDEGKLAHGMKDKAKTVDDLKQEIEMVKL